jgi:hypothetical protein
MGFISGLKLFNSKSMDGNLSKSKYEVLGVGRVSKSIISHFKGFSSENLRGCDFGVSNSSNLVFSLTSFLFTHEMETKINKRLKISKLATNLDFLSPFSVTNIDFLFEFLFIALDYKLQFKAISLLRA